MRYRPIALVDLPGVQRLYHQMLAESSAETPLHYPRWTAETPAELTRALYDHLTGPGTGFVGVVAVLGNRVKGFAFGELYARPLGLPKWVGHCTHVYVEPKSRGAIGTRAVGPQLIRTLAAEATARCPGLVLEASYTPGTHGAVLWPRLGFVPYRVTAAYVDRDGRARPASDLLPAKPHAA